MEYRKRLWESKRVMSPSYEAVARPIYWGAVGRWRNYAGLLEPMMGVLEGFVGGFGYEH